MLHILVRDAGRQHVHDQVPSSACAAPCACRNQPISEVERALNKELLSKTEQWKETGRVQIGHA